jgi:hypothetical protein
VAPVGARSCAPHRSQERKTLPASVQLAATSVEKSLHVCMHSLTEAAPRIADKGIAQRQATIRTRVGIHLRRRGKRKETQANSVGSIVTIKRKMKSGSATGCTKPLARRMGSVTPNAGGQSITASIAIARRTPSTLRNTCILPVSVGTVGSSEKDNSLASSETV